MISRKLDVAFNVNNTTKQSNSLWNHWYTVSFCKYSHWARQIVHVINCVVKQPLT